MGSRTDRSSAWHGVTEGWIPSRGGPRAGQAPCFLPTQVPPLLPPEILFCSFWASSFPEALLPWLSLPTSREAKQEEVGSHHLSSSSSPPRPEMAAGGGGCAGMQGCGGCLGFVGLERGRAAWRRRALAGGFVSYSPWRGGGLLMLITNSKNKRGEEKLN